MWKQYPRASHRADVYCAEAGSSAVVPKEDQLAMKDTAGRAGGYAMGFIYMWKLDTERKALLEKATAPRCSQKKRKQYLAEAEAIQKEIFDRWRKGIAAQVRRAVDEALPESV